jgi:hypothetical protein
LGRFIGGIVLSNDAVVRTRDRFGAAHAAQTDSEAAAPSFLVFVPAPHDDARVVEAHVVFASRALILGDLHDPSAAFAVAAIRAERGFFGRDADGVH